jgi:hypothetical protein
MANFKPLRKTKSALSTTQIVDGQFLFATDTRELFVDVGNTRLQCVFPVPEIEPLTIRLGNRLWEYDGINPVDIDLDATIWVNVDHYNGIASVSGAGWYRPNTACIISCTVQSGYQFDGWYMNGSKVSGDTTYAFPVGSENMSLIAQANAISTPPSGGGGSDEPTDPPTGEPPTDEPPTGSPSPVPDPSTPIEPPTDEPTDPPTEVPTGE